MNAIVAIVRRLAWALVIVFGVTTAAFVMTSVLPGDPVQAALGPQASPDDVARAREVYGLDRPASERYVRFLSRLLHTTEGDRPVAAGPGHASCGEIGLGLHVDLGTSFTYRAPIVTLVKKRLPASLWLALAATVVQLTLGLGLGALAATRRGSRGDQAIVGGSVVLGAAPTFIVGLILQYILAYWLQWLPLDGYGATTAERALHIVLPAATLGLYGTALFVRLVRSELGARLADPHVVAVRARGASKLRAGVVHALRSAAAPIAQLGVLDLGALIGGAIVTERIFRWPGLGELAIVAIQNRDAQAIVAVTLVASVAVVLATLVADLVGLWLDPRLRR